MTRRPTFVLVTGGVVLLGLAAGIPRLYYEVDFGDQSLVLRSVRFMEANFRKPMTTELVVTIPEGKRIYDEESLRLLQRLEDYFDGRAEQWDRLELPRFPRGGLSHRSRQTGCLLR